MSCHVQKQRGGRTCQQEVRKCVRVQHSAVRVDEGRKGRKEGEERGDNRVEHLPAEEDRGKNNQVRAKNHPYMCVRVFERER